MPSELETVKAELETTKTALKAATEKGDSDSKKVKDLESKIAKLEASAKEACAKCGSTEHMTENHTKENSANNDDDENDKNGKGAKKAKQRDPAIVALEAKVSAPLIEEMLKAREATGATEEDLNAFRESLKGKTFAEIETQHNNEKVFITSVKAKQTPEGDHFEFGTPSKPLTAKSLEETFEEITA